MPNPPKHPSRRQNKITPVVGLVEVVDGAHPVPPAPGDWLPESLNAWAGFWQSPAAEILADHHRPTLDRLFTLRDKQARDLAEVERLRELTRADGFEQFTAGSTGQAKLNPLFDLIDKIEARILSTEAAISRLEDKFPLTPAAELKLGVTFQKRQNLEALNAQIFAAQITDPPDPRALPASLPRSS